MISKNKIWKSTYGFTLDKRAICSIWNASCSQSRFKGNTCEPPLTVLSKVHCFSEFLDVKVVIPVNQVSSMVISFLKETSKSLISEFLDIKLMNLEERTENVLDLIPLLVFQCLKVYQIFNN